MGHRNLERREADVRKPSSEVVNVILKGLLGPKRCNPRLNVHRLLRGGIGRFGAEPCEAVERREFFLERCVVEPVPLRIRLRLRASLSVSHTVPR